jgi:hypothetical protein
MMMLWLLQQQQPPPDSFVVKIIQPPSDVEGLADVLLGALGLTGVLVLSGIALALLFAGGLYLFRFKFGDPFPSASEQRPGDSGPAGRITR